MSIPTVSKSFTDRDFFADPIGTSGIKRLVAHGQILKTPEGKVEGTSGNVTYELGFCVQLDASYCLLIASMDEQGGGDLCVGNDAFVFERLSDISPERAIPINRVDPNYKLKHSEGHTFLAKFPGPIGFIPLGSKLDDGRDHPGAGSGFFLSGCVAKEGKHAAMTPESPFELIQLRWDGESLAVSPGILIEELLGLELNGNCSITNALPHGESLLLPMGVGDCIRIFQFDWGGEKWAATSVGAPFVTIAGRPAIPGEEHKYSPAEIEPSLRRQGDQFFVSTRGNDGVGRLYSSPDGFNFTLHATRPNHTVPQVLNQGLDGNFYIATNPGPGMIRNPLLAYPFVNGLWGEPFTIHDEQGIRGDKESIIPFIDHSIASNVFLEGRWRHFNLFRVCDLTERTLHAFQIEQGLDEVIYGKDGPRKSKLPTSGLYLVELEYE